MEILKPNILKPALRKVGLFKPSLLSAGKPHGGKVKPYIAGHVTDGASTFTFYVNGNQSITVPVGADGKWKWIQDRNITSLKRMVCQTTTTYADNIDYLEINATLENCTNFGVAIALTPLEKVVIKTQTGLVTDLAYLAQDCKSLKEFIAPLLKFSNNSNYGRMFLRCERLEVVDLSSAILKSSQSAYFEGCISLKRLKIGGVSNNFNIKDTAVLTEQSVVNIFNAVAADNITLTFHATVYAYIQAQLEIEDSPIYNAYWDSEYDFTIASA